ncbi:MAG: bifunctional riboflavin kinase/FMN adenylyltransferase [Candidatus Binatia bacterium]
MRIVHELINIGKEVPRPVLTIGNFDGVHLGHQAIFQQVIQWAQTTNGTSIVLTFHPHPMKFFRPSQPPLLITTLEEKMCLLEKLGIQLVLSLNFTPELARMDPEEFVGEVLWEKIRLRDLVVGHDFAFGRHRQGNIPYLQKRGAELGFDVHTVDQIEIEGTIVSSSLVRRLIQEGEVERAARFLGRPYSLGGEIQDIDKPYEGNGPLTLGFRPQKELLPSPGFYVVKATGEGQLAPDITCIGICRVLVGPEISLRLHFSNDLSQLEGRKALRLAFLQRLCRSEECYTLLFNAKCKTQNAK